ncbi:MAG: hypothetical protein HYV09_01165 [Deltaproteobacteria bacterium]|nr:hypothetical protein [Deltaproteobacteria bacterium]
MLLVSAPAAAVKLRRPFTSATARNYGFDNNGGAGGCTDYACKGACYDTHSGTDFPIKLGLVLLDLVLAAADGKVVAVVNACGDFGWAGNSCGGYCGNYVKIRHPDGSRTPIRPTPTVTAWATSASRPTR